MPKWVKGKELAEHLNVTEGCISQLKKKGVLRIGLNKRFDLEESVKNYNEYKTNMPRIDKRRPLPLDDPGTKKPATSAPENRPEDDHVRQYHKSRAAMEGLKLREKLITVQELERTRVNKNLLYPLITSFSMKRDAKIKALLTAIPKRTALNWPNPHEAVKLEKMLNDLIHDALLQLSEIDLADIETELYQQTG